MLGRKTYTPQELDNARTAIEQQLTAYKALRSAAGADPKAAAALEAFEPILLKNLLLALDRRFVHRLRGSTGKDANPLNEVELLTESLLNNGGVLRGNNVIKLVCEQTVLGLEVGDRIVLDAEQFERLAEAFLAEIDARFVQTGA
jgi:hypothetical protein